MHILLSESTSRHLSNFSLYMLYCTALFIFSNRSLGEATYKLFLVSSFLSILLYRQNRWRITALLVVLASIIIQVASWSYSLVHHPQYAEPDPEIKRLASLLLFVLVAWTLYINKRQPWLLFLLFLVGTSLTPFTKGDGIDEFLGTRSNFGFLNAQHPAMMFSIAFVGLAVFAKRIFLTFPLRRNPVVILYTFALLYCVAVLAVTNTRGIFVGLLIAFLLALFANAQQLLYRDKRKIWIATIIAAAICIPLAMNSGHLTERWIAESSDFRGIAEGNLEDISNRTSVGIRIHSWVAAYQGFLNSPLLGWGDNGKKIALVQSETLPEDIKARFGHLHNSFLEILTNNGLLGLAFIVFVYFWIVRTIFSANPKLDSDVRTFVLSSGSLWLIANCFESYMFYKSGIMTFAIIAGGLTSIGLISDEQAQDDNKKPA